jgi:hypothetical protein
VAASPVFCAARLAGVRRCPNQETEVVGGRPGRGEPNPGGRYLVRGYPPVDLNAYASASLVAECGVRKLGSACKSARCGSADSSTNTKPPREFANATGLRAPAPNDPRLNLRDWERSYSGPWPMTRPQSGRGAGFFARGAGTGAQLRRPSVLRAPGHPRRLLPGRGSRLRPPGSRCLHQAHQSRDRGAQGEGLAAGGGEARA